MSEREPYIDAFIKTINKGPFASLREVHEGKDSEAVQKRGRNSFAEIDRNGNNNPDLFDCAVYQAYLDMNRTIAGVSKDEQKTNEIKGIRDYIAKQLECYFKPKRRMSSCQTCFDCWHAITMNEAEKNGVCTHLRIGQIQKIINMAFKYLYCCNDFRDGHPGYFDYCHMALDGYTLAWLERLKPDCCRGLPKNDGRRQWSKIEDISRYKGILIAIREACVQSEWPLTDSPFLAEFEIWPHELYLENLTKLEAAARGTLEYAGKDEHFGLTDCLKNALDGALMTRKAAIRKYELKDKCRK